MDCCVICLEVAIDSLPYIYIDSNEWRKGNTKRIIEKHLWWWHLQQPTSKKCSYICGQCWKMLSSFHAFYLQVKKVHQQYDIRNWPVLKGSIVEEKSYIKEMHAAAKVMGEDCEKYITSSNETRLNTPNRKETVTKSQTTRQYDEYLAKSGYQFYCDVCNIALKCFTELKSHYRLEHDVAGYALCCNKKFYNRGQFSDHLKVHENPNYFKCSFCSKVLSHRLSYENHLKCHKLSIKRNLVCSECKKSFCTNDDYDRHMPLHRKYISNNIEAEELFTVTNSERTTSFVNNINERDDYTDVDGVVASYDETLSSICQNGFINVFQNTETRKSVPVIKSESITSSENVGQIISDNYVDTHLEPSLNIAENKRINISENIETNETSRVICSENGEIFNYSFIEESSNCSNKGETQYCEQAKNIKYELNFKNGRKCNVDEYFKHIKYTVSCHLCMAPFANFFALKSHCRLEHNTNGYAMCCNRKMYNSVQFAGHLKVHVNPNYFKCTICNRVFRHRKTYETHIQTHKAQLKGVHCDICGEKFSDNTVLYRHQNKIHSKEMQNEQICSYCTKISPNMQAHRAHIRYNHTKGLRHACHLCEKKFNRPFHLREHLSTHTGVPLHACPYCARPFKSIANMHTHRKKVHPKEWQEERIKRLAARKLKK